jgi:hypothetical protein
MTQADLAAAAGLHRIGVVESGRRSLEVTTLVLIVRALEVPLEEVVGGIVWIPDCPPGSGRWRVRAAA